MLIVDTRYKGFNRALSVFHCLWR